MKNYSTILRQHNLKATPQRLAITDVLQTKGHISLEELYVLMLAKFESISLATIYKNIHIMMQNSFIQEVKLPHAKAVYELTKGAHAHLACKKCNHVEDIVLNIDEVMKSATKETNFKIESNDLIFVGVCAKCQ